MAEKYELFYFAKIETSNRELNVITEALNVHLKSTPDDREIVYVDALTFPVVTVGVRALSTDSVEVMKEKMKGFIHNALDPHVRILSDTLSTNKEFTDVQPTREEVEKILAGGESSGA